MTAERRGIVETKDDGQTEKYWDPEWGDIGAAPQGVSYLDPEGGEEEPHE